MGRLPFLFSHRSATPVGRLRRCQTRRVGDDWPLRRNRLKFIVGEILLDADCVPDDYTEISVATPHGAAVRIRIIQLLADSRLGVVETCFVTACRSHPSTE